MYISILAITRVVGFEPTNTGTKTLCLTIWRYPISAVRCCVRRKIYTIKAIKAQFSSSETRTVAIHRLLLRQNRFVFRLIPIYCITTVYSVHYTDTELRQFHVLLTTKPALTNFQRGMCFHCHVIANVWQLTSTYKFFTSLICD